MSGTVAKNCHVGGTVAKNGHVERGASSTVAKHWSRGRCKSDWVPQEAWYKYQRYVPRQLNNKPPPPINDFDFMNSYAQTRGDPSRGPWRGIDDFTLGNAEAAVGAGSEGMGRNDDDVHVARFDDAHVTEPEE